jgi:hypothetical protein
LGYGSDQPANVVWTGDICIHPEDINPGFLGDLSGSHANPLKTSGADGNARTLGGNRSRTSEAQAATCSGDQRNFITKS